MTDLDFTLQLEMDAENAEAEREWIDKYNQQNQPLRPPRLNPNPD